MPLISTLAGAASRAYGFLANSLTYFVGTLGAGTFSVGFRVDSSLNNWSVRYAMDYSFAEILKTDSVLKYISQTKLSSSGTTQIYRVEVDSSDNLYIWGYGPTQNWLGKLDSSLGIVWQKTGGDAFYDFCLDASNIYAITDTNKIVKLDYSGTVVDKYKLVYSGNELELRNITVDTSGNIYITTAL